MNEIIEYAVENSRKTREAMGNRNMSVNHFTQICPFTTDCGYILFPDLIKPDNSFWFVIPHLA